MPTAHKVLGQVADASANDVTLVADQNGEVVISTIVVCNRESSENTFRLAVRPDAATLADEHYISYDVPVPANDTIFLTLGLCIDDNDIITCGASDANVSFSAFGAVIT